MSRNSVKINTSCIGIMLKLLYAVKNFTKYTIQLVNCCFYFSFSDKKINCFFSISHYKRNYERKFINQLLDNLVIKSFLP